MPKHLTTMAGNHRSGSPAMPIRGAGLRSGDDAQEEELRFGFGGGMGPVPGQCTAGNPAVGGIPPAAGSGTRGAAPSNPVSLGQHAAAQQVVFRQEGG